MAEKSLSAEVEKQLAEIDDMTLADVRALLVKCMTDIIEGRVTAYEGVTLNCAANRRVQALKKALFSLS